MTRQITSLAAAVFVAFNAAASAQDRITPPAVPIDIEVEAGYKPFFRGHAVGTQNYICAPAATPSGVDWLPIGPQATIFDEAMEQTMTHYASKNPLKNDAIQATWQHSRDSGAVWAKRKAGSTDANYVAPDAIEWLLLEVTGEMAGPTGGDKLTGALFLQRVNTVGGKAPATGCSAETVNTRRFVAYEADYYFYR
jgi:hypothetical protein